MMTYVSSSVRNFVPAVYQGKLPVSIVNKGPTWRMCVHTSIPNTDSVH